MGETSVVGSKRDARRMSLGWADLEQIKGAQDADESGMGRIILGD